MEHDEAASNDHALPGAADPHRGALLEEWIGRDLTRRWSEGEHPRIDEYATRFPELGPARDLSPTLILLEYRARHLAGDQPTLTEFKQRFPLQFVMLRQLIGQDPQSHGEVATHRATESEKSSTPRSAIEGTEPPPPAKPFSYIEQGLAEEAARPRPRRGPRLLRSLFGAFIGLAAGIVLFAVVLHLNAGVLRPFIVNDLSYWIFAASGLIISSVIGTVYAASGAPLPSVLAGAGIFAPLGLLAGAADDIHFDRADGLLLLTYAPLSDDFPLGLVIGLVAGAGVGAILGRAVRAPGSGFARVVVGGLFAAVGIVLVRGFWINGGIEFFNGETDGGLWSAPRLALQPHLALWGIAVGGILAGLSGRLWART